MSLIKSLTTPFTKADGADHAKPPDDAIVFYPSQMPLVQDNQTGTLPYTGGPLLLLWADIQLFFQCAPSIAGIFWPFKVRNADIRDELYLCDRQNWICIGLHTFLFICQMLFLISCILGLFVPVFWFTVWFSGFMVFNMLVCLLLNGTTPRLVSQVPVENEDKYASEYWIFLNGVSVGRHWLQANCDRLSETFGRRIHGVHNPTDGIIFDLAQCLIQRAFSYSTQDVRDAYALVKKAIMDDRYKKVVFILHSQGGIEGGLIVDWLLDEVPHDLLHRLELYTFGNAANHFNNPHTRSLHQQYSPYQLSLQTKATETKKGAIRHIEHYANSGDFVARFGVLNYMATANRFMGRVFQSPNSGHLLNQHYLHQMFPLTEDRKANERNAFMKMKVSFSKEQQKGMLRETVLTSFFNAGDRTGDPEVAFVGDSNSPITISNPKSPVASEREERDITVGDLSRLWKYRNGMSPDE